MPQSQFIKKDTEQIVYCCIRSKSGTFCGEFVEVGGRRRSPATTDEPQKVTFTPNGTYYFFFKRQKISLINITFTSNILASKLKCKIYTKGGL